MWAVGQAVPQRRNIKFPLNTDRPLLPPHSQTGTLKEQHTLSDDFNIKNFFYFTKVGNIRSTLVLTAQSSHSDWSDHIQFCQTKQMWQKGKVFLFIQKVQFRKSHRSQYVFPLKKLPHTFFIRTTLTHRSTATTKLTLQREWYVKYNNNIMSRTSCEVLKVAKKAALYIKMSLFIS